jgi:hypothetical protein
LGRLFLAWAIVMLSVVIVSLRMRGSEREAAAASDTFDALASGAMDANGETALANALVSALNRRDEDAVAHLFDPYGTVQADRYASETDGIRAWTRMQIAASVRIQVEEEGFRAQANETQWTTSVRRADWAARGFPSVRMFNEIWTEGDRITQYSAFPIDGSLVTSLGDLWQPRVPPSRVPGWTSGSPEATSVAFSASILSVGMMLVVGLVAVAAMGAHARAGGTHVRRRRPAWAMSTLGDWHRFGRHL